MKWKKGKRYLDLGGGRISNGGHTKERSRGKNIHFSVRKEDRVGTPKRDVS